MSFTFAISELHEEYHSVSKEEALVIANLGAACYTVARKSMYAQWSASMAGDEASKAAIWRAEGRQSLMESMAATLAASESAIARAAAAEGRLQQVNSNIDAEIAQRLVPIREGFNKDIEMAKMIERRDADMAKMAEISALKEQIAAAEARIRQVRESGEAEIKGRLQDAALRSMSELTSLKEQLMSENSALRERVALAEQRDLVPILRQALTATESEVIFLREKLDTASAAVKAFEQEKTTKSSHALGKQGEATVLSMLEEFVLTEFPHSDVKEMSHVPHAADFHLWIMSPTGTRVKLLLDSKNCSWPVKSSEVTKLYNDVNADDDSHGGILLSLLTPIVGKRQFEIRNAPHKKPVLHVTFAGVEPWQQKDLLCWAVRVLVAVVCESDYGKQTQIIEDMEHFRSDLNTTLKSVDCAIKMQLQVVDTLRKTRSTMHQMSVMRCFNTVPAAASTVALVPAASSVTPVPAASIATPVSAQTDDIIIADGDDHSSVVLEDELSLLAQQPAEGAKNGSGGIESVPVAVGDSGCIARTKGSVCGKPTYLGRYKCYTHLSESQKAILQHAGLPVTTEHTGKRGRPRKVANRSGVQQ
jgi:hypothetical protein